MAMYRPRGTLARVIHDKFHNDNFLDNIDTRKWYSLDTESIPAKFQSKFVALEQPDKTTVRWLERAKMLSANIWMHLWHALARSVLQFFMTQTDINGFLKRGSMFILSEEQFYKLLHAGGFPAGSESDTVTLLDIGAGDGQISIRIANTVAKLSNACIQVFATEASWTMRDRLKKLNFNVINEIRGLQNVELILCLNVLDRCFDPFQLLEDIHNTLAPRGRAVVALVLPYMHYVETNTSHLPLRPLLESNNRNNGPQVSFEEEATQFLELLENCGFRVESWTKAPYLCEGDLHQSFYWLIDLIVVLSKK
ncbi:methyltransferase-like protein 9 [Scaptodrosophila lebanonensis]|uniref:Methyltransferase-like protein 9 n=1 Tax=Drosophila lebanonensis TaxID=7225 RepID=A0A6J2TBY1_DROLE|nr:methyltransferase-like protein 9 [Scaptodrosophila lebanonensis]